MARTFNLDPTVSPIEMAFNPLRGEPVLPVPDIMEFIFSDKYLNRPNLYPRQATILKVIFLQDELFTDYDYEVLAQWSEGFTLPEIGDGGDMRYQGTWGCQPDILERIAINKAAGRKWFRECVMVLGRRGGKGFIGAIAGAYVLWNYLAEGNPQQHYGVDRDKRLTAMVFAGKFQQARDEQWRDLYNVIMGAPCFSPYVSNALGESLTLYAPADAARLRERESRGVKTDNDLATFEVIPRESTTMGPRGKASFLLYFDEMAFVVAAGASRSAEDVYHAAIPSLDQFKQDGFIYEGSSPWQMMGQYYENWENSLAVEKVLITPNSNETKLVPIYPEMFMVQLASWDIYKDWERAPEIKIRKGWKRTFPALPGAIQEYDDQMRKLERANPETFAVERRARWAAALNAYLDPKRINQMFSPWEGREIESQDRGILNRMYVAHLDPSKVNANTGFALAHTEGPDEDGMMHVVFDKITHWSPGDFVDNELQIDYAEIEDFLKHDIIDHFVPEHISMDQFNTVFLLQRLRQYVNSKQFPRRIQIYERTATKKINWQVAEIFKSALNMGLIHAPYNEQAVLEMTFLTDMGNERVDHPTTGPVQTKDVFDAISNVVYTLIGDQMSAFLGQEFSDFNMSAAMQGGQRPFPEMDGEASQIIDQFRSFSNRERVNLAHSSPSRSVTRNPGAPWRPASPWSR